MSDTKKAQQQEWRNLIEALATDIFRQNAKISSSAQAIRNMADHIEAFAASQVQEALTKKLVCKKCGERIEPDYGHCTKHGGCHVPAIRSTKGGNNNG